jgi:hypothetical protein
VCNLYTLRKGPAAILDLARAMTSHVGNLEPGDVYPDYAAPIVRQGAASAGTRAGNQIAWPALSGLNSDLGSAEPATDERFHG